MFSRRDLIRARTREGRARAKARGVHMGRPPALTRHQREEALRDLAKGRATQADLARRFNVSRIHDFEAVAMNEDNIDYRRLAELYEEFNELWMRLHAFYLDAVAGFRLVASYVQSEQSRARNFVQGSDMDLGGGAGRANFQL